MSRAICGICMCLEDETGCGCLKEEMNNEPVAYGKYLKEHDYWVTASGIIPNPKEGYVPLYTHPAKTLTDEDCECLEGLMGMYWDLAFKEGSQGINLSEQANDVLYSFRAILRKAQENG